MENQRTVSVIAREIKSNWGSKVNYAAKPYLDAMLTIHDINGRFYDDSAKSIVLYFLSNASAYRGELAKQHKKELKTILNVK